MKKFYCSIFSLYIFLFAYCQEKYPHKKGSVIAVHFTLHDFQTVSDTKAYGLSSVLQEKQWYKTEHMGKGFALSYSQGLTDHLDIMARLGASFLTYPVPGKSASDEKGTLIESDANLHVKLTSDRYWFSPYLSAGAGISKYKSYYAAYLPLGLGLQANLFDESFLFVTANYRLAVTSNAEDHLFYGFGIGGLIGKKKEIAVVPLPAIPVAVVPFDSDFDGIVDSLDVCPSIAGLAQFNGCPDTDKDGLQDKDDKCPDLAGLAKYNGCPIPDTDKDGINDEQDKCPEIIGIARYQGCPIPDGDGDGINDEEDRCPGISGTIQNQGCPAINFNAKNVQFIIGSATLTADAKKELDKAADFLNNTYPGIRISIEGHTDNTGTEISNQKLSEERANAVKTYLVKKKVNTDRLIAIGYGQSKPIADNNTSEGKAENRRVEFRVSQ